MQTGFAAHAYLVHREGVLRMSTTSMRRSVIVAVVLAALAVPSWAAAAVETFHGFEANAVANYVIDVTCTDGSTVEQRVQVIAGHRRSPRTASRLKTVTSSASASSASTAPAASLTERGAGDAEFTWSPSLQEAAVTGTVTMDQDRVVTVDMSWEGTGPVETTSNTTIFPGFVGHFTGKERDGVATGTVVVDGATLVDGSTVNASIETLEDNDTTTGQA